MDYTENKPNIRGVYKGSSWGGMRRTGGGRAFRILLARLPAMNSREKGREDARNVRDVWELMLLHCSDRAGCDIVVTDSEAWEWK